jgi:two-component system NtrC family sensor kinase
VLAGLYHEVLPDEPDAAPVPAPQEGVYNWLPTGTQAVRPLLRPRDGHLLPLSVRVDRLTQAGETYLLVVARDMSGCWEQAQNLFQNEKLAAIGRLMSGIAHEMNNPLQAIYNTLSLLTNNTVNGDNIEKRKHYLMMSRQEVEHLIGMVQRVLDIYRPTRDGMREVNLHDLLQAVTPVIRQQQQDYDVLVLYELQPDLPFIQGIASHLKQVYESLIINAMESMSPGGVLTIRSYMTCDPPNHNHELNAGQFIQAGRGTEQHQTWQPNQPLVVVEFSDTGRGIPSDELGKVFEPFYTTRSNGVGLSLAMCYGIVEQHNGRLAVSSVVGRGTTVRLYLPVMP